jgi:hypothetical protein
MEKWKSAKNFEDMLNCNILFLEGKLKCTPLWNGPISEETKHIKKDLIKLNKDYKIFTIESQPSLIINKEKNNYITKKIYDMCENIDNFKYFLDDQYIYSQKGYLECCFYGDLMETSMKIIKKTKLKFFALQNGNVITNMKKDKNKDSNKSIVSLYTFFNHQNYYLDQHIKLDKNFFKERNISNYDNDKYKMSKENNIIFMFCVVDGVLEEPNQCCKELMNAFSK